MGLNNLDYSTLAVAGTAVSLATDSSPVMPTGTKGAVITVETDQVRYRDDGTAPTSSEGHLLDAGDVLNFDSWTVPEQNWKEVLKSLRFIRVTNTAALKISWYD